MPLALRVAATDAERALREILRAGIMDASRRTRRIGDDVLIPVRDDGPDAKKVAAALGAAVVADDAPVAREERVAPYDQILARLPPEARPHAPDKWEKLGDVVVLRLADGARPFVADIARAFADVLECRAVVEDQSGVAGELREMDGALLLGESAETTTIENGVKYRLDAARIMFSSGNLAERKRAASLRGPGETIVDMFAGIGYFTLPIAIHSGAARVIAIEKNPISFRYLQENVRLNGVEHIVAPWLGDNREYPHIGLADRVLMGYFPETQRFLPHALAMLKPAGGVVHYHNTAHERVWKDELTREFLDAARACGRVVAIEEARVVKSHSPGVVHAVLVARVRSA